MAMIGKLSRRRLGSVALAGLAAWPAAQTPAAAQASSRSPQEDLEAARRSLKTAAEELSRFNIPRGTEPAFLFRA